MVDFYKIKKYCLDPFSIVYASNIEIINNSSSFFQKVISMIRSAKESICIEFYEIASDKFGILIRDELYKKLNEGVKVRIIYDSIGSRLSSKIFFDDMRKKGIKVIEYNPIRILSSIRRWFRRDHRKIMIVDFSKAMVGGFNLSLDYVPYYFGGSNWKDFGVYFEGEAVSKLLEIFKETWLSCGGDDFDMKKVEGGNVPVSFSWEFGIRNIHSVRRAYKYAMDNAKNHIYITNAYFLPDRLIYRCLKRAVMRGVDVKILLPYKTDHPYVRLASFHIVKNLLKHGIEVYEWQKEVLHSKTCVIDNFWCSIGSHNLDHMSLHYNLELNINIFDEKIGTEMRRLFEEDLKNSKKILIEDIKRLPLSTKIASNILYNLREFL